MPRFFRSKGRSTINLPIYTPPTIEDNAYKRWYRVASDISQLPDQYADEEGGPEEPEEPEDEEREGGRHTWSNQLEFLMSCIATSVGLGNVWRFAFIAYQNGGGAFLIPYIIVLILIGKPMYYLECILGQFSSRNSVRVWSLSPAMIGTGYTQSLCCGYIVSYYVVIIALCMYYLAMSVNPVLPWTVCRPEWEDCVPADPNLPKIVTSENATSSAEIYFIKAVLQQSDGIEGALQTPIWYLLLCLLAAWLIIFGIIVRGVKSSGKAAYFLALFPYVVMIILLVTTVTLPGSANGILFFITPDWAKISELSVWYAAVTQVFFSLGVGVGPIIMFSSYNMFESKSYRDAFIVTTLDTMTSLLSGFTIFGILGNLAYELKSDIDEVVGSGGTGLAFISYPDAIAKTFLPHLFAVLFFLMMTVLGIGSAVAYMSTINTVMLDAFPKVRTVYISGVCCILGFLSGIVYVTPGGQFVLELVDYYGGTFLALFGAIVEIIGISWIYGLENICLDLEFMLGVKTSWYWRMCWGVITPFIMILVFSYALINFEALVFGGYYIYPTLAYICGYLMLFLGISFVPIFIFMILYQKWTGKCIETIKAAFKPKQTWGPRELTTRKHWTAFKRVAKEREAQMRRNKFQHLWMVLTGGYRKNI